MQPDLDEKLWSFSNKEKMASYCKVPDLFFSDVIKAGTYACHGLTNYVEESLTDGSFDNYFDFIHESISLFFYKMEYILKIIKEETDIGLHTRKDILLDCILYYMTFPHTQRSLFMSGRDALVGSVDGGEIAYRWHSHCDYLRHEDDKKRRLFFTYRTLAEFMRGGNVLMPELPYERIDNVVIPRAVEGVPFLSRE